jgi:hypothetical protein
MTGFPDANSGCRFAGNQVPQRRTSDCREEASLQAANPLLEVAGFRPAAFRLSPSGRLGPDSDIEASPQSHVGAVRPES